MKFLNQDQANKIVVGFIFAFLIVILCTRIYRHQIILSDIPNAFIKNSGARALPPESQFIRMIAERQALTEVSFEESINKSRFYPRDVEYLYPIKITQNNEFIFTKNKAELNKNCVLLDKEADIELYRCKK